MVASTDSKHNQAELKSETTTDPLTMQCGAENIQNKTKDEITENCAVQHAGNNKTAVLSDYVLNPLKQPLHQVVPHMIPRCRQL
jgi:hypothetical protein